MSIRKKDSAVAVMQPYFFPYMGYFQLIHAVDVFVFYDDVNFIKNGWINRNRILVNGQARYLTVALKNASSFKPIMETEYADNRPKLLKMILLTYKRAPFFKQVWPLIESCLSHPADRISDLAINSVISVCNYLEVETRIEVSSRDYPETKCLQRSDRLIEICRKNTATVYINPEGGAEIYDKTYFSERGVELRFLKSRFSSYDQRSSTFVPGLSIIDVMMFNAPDTIRSFLEDYELI